MAKKCPDQRTWVTCFFVMLVLAGLLWVAFFVIWEAPDDATKLTTAQLTIAVFASVATGCGVASCCGAMCVDHEFETDLGVP